MRVAVLMGGASGEREVSLSTGRQIVAALDPSKYTPVAVDPAPLLGRPPATVHELPIEPLDVSAWSRRGSSQRPDVAFIALHGKGGEDGAIQGLLEWLGIPFTGSGVLASALAMDKAMTKRLLRADGIPVPDDVVIRRHDDPVQAAEARLGYPLIVKPNREGSTIGCTIVREADALPEAIADALRHDETALVERLVPGVEITAGLLGNRSPQALPLIEIVARGGFYDYEAKYAPGGSEHIIPARISDLAAQRAREYAQRTHDLLGCRGMSRVDMIVADDEPVVLEINTIPGMTPTSLLPDAAKAAGIGFSELLDRIIALALEA